MLFNSFEFFLFLPIVFGLYWWVVNKNINAQNTLILIASYIFYGWWDWRFLFLIAFSTIVDYWCGLSIFKAKRSSDKKLFLGISLFVNLGLLVFFKYFNFFIESWIDAWSLVGITMHASSLNLILPVGISFYTFQTLSYSIDIYRGTFKPTNDIIAFSAFVSFFPQLVAGPIERASHLLPQFFIEKKISYNDITKGIRLIIWGLFKKVAIADLIATSVNLTFSNYSDLSSFDLLIGAFFFAFQIYCDFSGYSDIAIGTAKLFGYDLMTNFRFPYFSRNISEFWRRWHISLSTWFRDYLYIPLGGSRVSKSKVIRNIFIIFLVSGFWHGANWTFIIWGLIHAICFMPEYILGTNRKYVNNDLEHKSLNQRIFSFLKIPFTFLIVTLAWIFFRADSVSDALKYIMRIFSFTGIPNTDGIMLKCSLIFALIAYEWINRNNEEQIFNHKSKILNYVLISAAVWMIFINASNGKQEFIYFQF